MMNLSRIEYLFYIPFVEHGRDENGIDCWGLVYLFYKDFFGINLNPYKDDYYFFERNICKEDVQKVINKEFMTGNWMYKDDPEFGDVVILTLAGRPFHAGIVVDDKKGKMIHCLNKIGVCQDNFNDHKYKNRIEGFYKYVGTV